MTISHTVGADAYTLHFSYGRDIVLTAKQMEMLARLIGATLGGLHGGVK